MAVNPRATKIILGNIDGSVRSCLIALRNWASSSAAILAVSIRAAARVLLPWRIRSCCPVGGPSGSRGAGSASCPLGDPAHSGTAYCPEGARAAGVDWNAAYWPDWAANACPVCAAYWSAGDGYDPEGAW